MKDRMENIIEQLENIQSTMTDTYDELEGFEGVLKSLKDGFADNEQDDDTECERAFSVWNDTKYAWFELGYVLKDLEKIIKRLEEAKEEIDDDEE